MSLALQWADARPKVAGLHLDSGACSRQSLAVIDAVAAHARHEAEVGGYVAAEAAAPVLAVVDEAAAMLATDPPALVHFTALASHRGVAQPLAEMVAVCREAGVPIVVDGAQAFGHLDCNVGADAIYSSSRKWLAGPRGVGFLAVRPELVARLQRRLPPASWDVPVTVLQSFEHGEHNAATRIGYSVALGEHLAAGAELVRDRLAEVGRTARQVLADVPGWRVVERVDEPTAITTLEPTDGADPVAVRAWLIAERGIVTTACELARAPFEMTKPVLRVSPHVDTTAEDLEQFAEVLRTAP
ncbi:aminotransferase class V-fold PLP-dependent enzyme [Mycolicibacterium neworleansense]|uniref:Pyridoxal-phosphate-dependent transferase n=1 Tax=Mycolicibacterium neworleansense TaxID=146018 RepID=A0A0H5RUW3_9MYCO|nr:aminotransferase class V-fold PLP-dependent enzyme [Mycolicibacterium neworleansense]CRZ17723.1 pyridoxal-phosphate-dependent transferase [Mycolicibacterium neworleansense]